MNEALLAKKESSNQLSHQCELLLLQIWFRSLNTKTDSPTQDSLFNRPQPLLPQKPQLKLKKWWRAALQEQEQENPKSGGSFEENWQEERYISVFFMQFVKSCSKLQSQLRVQQEACHHFQFQSPSPISISHCLVCLGGVEKKRIGSICGINRQWKSHLEVILICFTKLKHSNQYFIS